MYIYYTNNPFDVFFHFAVNNSSFLKGKIVGGHTLGFKTKKFMASLRIEDKHFCGGFLISRKIVMSTGSCVCYMKLNGGPDFNKSTVFVGNVNFNAYTAKQIVNVDHVNHHPEYDPKNPIKTSGYDVGYVLVSFSTILIS